jgi:hypothetical protein
VTLHPGCERLPIALAQISKQSGIELHCTAAFEDEVVYISVDHEPARKLIDEIAVVCRGEWHT